jgi:ADP-dependent NAD(P)H-hydrate dehydratase / NAD(P)H-hydrate epimerase
VTVATPESVLPIVAAGMPEMMTVPLAATDAGTASFRNFDYGRFTETSRNKSVIAIGPGLSTHTETQQFIRALVAEAELPIILDADGLNAFAGMADQLTQRRASLMVITPHPGEMARLLGVTVKQVQARRLEVALEAAARWRANVILKGYHTILATPSGHVYINTTGNPGMATGGTGDVLTGILAGLTAQFGVEDWPRVLSLGIYLHGLAGDIAASRVGQAPLIASDLVEAMPEAYVRVTRRTGFSLSGLSCE